MRHKLFVGCLMMVLAGCHNQTDSLNPETKHFVSAPCEVGIYGTPESFIALTRRKDNFSYSFSDGRRAKIDTAANIECGGDVVRVDGRELFRKRPIKITDTEFYSGDVKLVGQLLEPIEASSETPLIVLAHGSEELGWIEAVNYPYQFVGRDVSVFVYDKRGTGRSEGAYSQNFPELADDLVAASEEAKRLAGSNYGRFGLYGFSQGGWIVPLAVERARGEFVGIGYGLLVDILEEDASQVELELREAGYGDDVIAKAKQITDVTARLAVSGYSDGLEDLDTLRDRYKNDPWYSIIRGGFTGVILGISTDELRTKGIPMFDRLNIDWSVKPMDVLQDVDVPQLWVLAENDREAPVAKTLDRLETIRRGGKDITIFMFPNTDHGMWEYKQDPDGRHEVTRVTDRYYDLLADWAKGKIETPYALSQEK